MYILCSHLASAVSTVLITVHCAVRGFQRYVSVRPYPYLRAPLQKYVRITFIRKNSVRSLRKNDVLRFRKFAVVVHPFK